MSSDQPSLAVRSIHATTYNFFANGLQLLVQFGRAILLARLLSPEVFGIYTLATAYVMLTRVFPLFGLTGALIHRAPESEGEGAQRVHFTLSLLFNSLWAFAMVLVGYFSQRVQLWVLLVFLSTEIVDNLVATARAILVKRVVFRRISLVDTLATTVGALLAVFLAWRGAGVWSLLSNDIAAAAISILGFYVIRPVWRPAFSLQRDIVRYFIHFGKRSLLASLLGQSLDQVDDVWVGTRLGEVALGFYSRAYAFATYPRRILAMPLTGVSLGAYAELKDKSKSLSQAFFRINAFLIRSGFFLGGWLALVAPEIIRLVIGAKWLPMLTAFRLMLLYTLLDPVNLTIANLFSALGVPEVVSKIRGAQLGVLVIGLVVATPAFGITGVAVVVDIMLVVGIGLMLVKARQYVSFSISKLTLAPAVSLVLGMGLARGALAIPGILGADWRTLIVKTGIFLFVYCLTLFMLERKHLPMLLNTLRMVFPRWGSSDV